MAADLYEVIGVDRNATDDEIKRAFRKRARTLHPDVNKEPDAEDRFKELNEAYDVLSDSHKRAQYDRFGTVGGPSMGGGGWSGGIDLDDLFGMGGIFSDFFSGGAASQGTRREGRDMGVGLRLTLEEIYTGVKKDITYDRLAPCSDCHGSGIGPDGEETMCPDCHGQGRVVTVQQTFLGNMQTTTSCPNCQGKGTVITNPCSECQGQGRVPDRQQVSLDIPAGIHDGQQLRVGGYGEAGLNGAAAGDLIVTCRVQPHEFFQREGDDLHAHVHLSIVQASLGCRIHVDGVVEGDSIEVKIPEGCQNDQVVRVKGRGMPRFRSDSFGDLYVHVGVSIPKKLSKRERELLEELGREMGEDIQDVRNPLQKLRDVFN